MSQMERILYIDRAIHNCGNFISAKEAASHFEVSVRQIKRDIEYMRNRMNAPIVYSAEHRAYCYEKEFNDLEFAGQDCIFAYLSLESILRSRSYSSLFRENLISKFEEQIPCDYRELSQKISYQLPQSQYINEESFEIICNSMLKKLCLKINYTDSQGNSSSRSIEAHRLVNYSGSWYIVAFDKDKKSLRTFNIPRISSLKLTKEKFDLHAENFDDEIKEFSSKGFGIFFGKKTVNVKIKFSGSSKQIVSSQIWHEKQKILFENDFLILEVPVASFTEILGKILSFGNTAIPLEPPELVTLWKTEIKKMSELI